MPDPCGRTQTSRERLPAIVAHARARSRGWCQLNGCRIDKGDPIVKVDVGRRGRQTAGGQGQGEWWCLDCALAHATE
jgi:hypothetical protein